MNIGASAFHGLLTLLVVNTQSFAQLQTEHLAHVQHHPSASKSGQYVAPSQQRNFYFPCSSRCAQPTQQIYRYRWVTTANSGPGRGVQQPPPQQPQPWLPPSSAVVQQPHNVRGAFVHLIFPQNSMVTAKTTTTTFATTTKIKNAPKTVTDTTKETTTSKRTSPSSPTTTTTTKSASKTIHPTLTTTHYALPTPPPYSPEQNIATAGEVIVRLNPCPHGQPLVNEFRNPITCNFVVQPNGACPEDYWCHTGSSYETTTCCPVGHLRDRCQLPRANGEGDALIPRWYFDSGDRKCKRFLYTGMRGNANNFVTAMACMESCETAANAAIVRNPCANGPPARDLNGEQFVCGTSDSRCPAGYYCHLGDNPLTNVCCELSAAVSDRCHLALRTGEGAAHLRRFYLNTLTRRCVQFIYRGAKGNENHFNSLAECRRECERPPNPCPFVFDVGIRKECRNDGNDGGDRCGRGEWCHFGSSRETTACCPGASDDPCKLPLDLGQGAENLTRWYAIPAEDACQRECRPFQYKGMKGNQNNFRTKATCEANCKADCPLTLNPCADEEPLLDPEGRPQRCNGTGPQCPADYWCHIGANAETTVCCSGATRICSLPLAEGVGNALLSRWYFNAKDGGCHRFIYRGIGGNQNNYVDFEQCMNACPEDSPLPNSSPSPPPLPPPTANPCGIGTPLAESGGPKARECSPNSRCPTSHFCHIGGDPSTVPNVCCPKNGDPCEQPLAEGIGQFKLTRYHFDAPSRRCRAFVYRGARGNANNFLSAEDCELVCQVAPPASPIRANPCPQGSPLADDQNEPLVCGNSLAAADLSLFGPLTTAHQHQLQTGCPSGYWCHVGSSPDTTNCCPQLTDGGKRSCDLPLEYGIGGQRLDRWYFDGNSQACRHFLYTGLKGNANSFVSREQCQQACPELVNFGTEQQQNSLGFVTDHQPQQLSSFPSLATTKAITKVITKTMTTPTSAPLPSPCLRGELLRNEDGQAIKCHPDDEVGCPMDTHFCHIGHHLNESGCCPRTAGTNPCLLPVNRGLGTATHVRWHFSAGVRRCEAFDYAGQKGNENNFVTKRHCEERCMKSSMLPVQFCPHGEPKWERSARGNRKKPISCGPNDGCPEGYVCHVNSENGMALCCENPAHFCLQAREHGPCNAQEVRYGYNPLTDTCVQYRYGGCGGTLNQFDSIERCTQICCRQYRRN
uniref:BPTI/Kunitz inhibitor domain-containing protein n=1 Tax=Globodera rostochiensis TaxID=31243 RepID=A0A914GYS8_GLORO